MSIKSFAFRQNLQNLFSSLHFCQMSNFKVLFKDMLLIIFEFRRIEYFQFALCDEVAVLEDIVFLVVHFRMHFESCNLNYISTSQRVQSSDVLICAVIIHNAMASWRCSGIIDIFEDYHCV